MREFAVASVLFGLQFLSLMMYTILLQAARDHFGDTAVHPVHRRLVRRHRLLPVAALAVPHSVVFGVDLRVVRPVVQWQGLHPQTNHGRTHPSTASPSFGYELCS
jgi:hypothetical protein